MTKEETSKILAILVVAGVRFEGDKGVVLNLWAESFKDIDYRFVSRATHDIILTETELFANGLIAKIRTRAKMLESLSIIERDKLEDRKCQLDTKK